jgi:hypothetical protein
MSRAAGGISLFALIVALGYGQEALAQSTGPCPQPGGTCGLDKFPGEGWLIMHRENTAIMSDATSDDLPST